MNPYKSYIYIYKGGLHWTILNSIPSWSIVFLKVHEFAGNVVVMRNLSSACKVILTVTYRNHAFQQFLHYSSYWPSGVIVSAAGVVTGPPSIKSRITWNSAGLFVRSSCLHAWLRFFGNFFRATKVPNGAKSYLEAAWRMRALLSGGGWNILRLRPCNGD